jgi:fructose-specific phosphotransferase system component IIB
MSKEGTVKARVKIFALGAAAAGAFLVSADVSRAQLLITGNDEKVRFDPATGKTVNQAPGKDTVSRSARTGVTSMSATSATVTSTSCVSTATC